MIWWHSTQVVKVKKFSLSSFLYAVTKDSPKWHQSHQWKMLVMWYWHDILKRMPQLSNLWWMQSAKVLLLLRERAYQNFFPTIPQTTYVWVSRKESICYGLGYSHVPKEKTCTFIRHLKKFSYSCPYFYQKFHCTLFPTHTFLKLLASFSWGSVFTLWNSMTVL